MIHIRVNAKHAVLVPGTVVADDLVKVSPQPRDRLVQIPLRVLFDDWLEFLEGFDGVSVVSHGYIAQATSHWAILPKFEDILNFQEPTYVVIQVIEDHKNNTASTSCLSMVDPAHTGDRIRLHCRIVHLRGCRGDGMVVMVCQVSRVDAEESVCE